MEGPLTAADRALATPLAPTTVHKQQKLRSLLEQMDSVIVAFSGGVDSAYLAVLAHRALGRRALAVTGESPSYPDHQRQMAVRVAESFSIAHRFVATAEIHDAAYLQNNPDRCFHCKSELYTRLGALAEEKGFRVIVDGANADDLADFRPGRKAARAMGVRSPLEEVALTKAEIRLLSESLGLPTAHEPASACLSSRIPYYTPISIQNLSQVERAEEAVRALGFRQLRVRHHDALARIELASEELLRALEPDTREALSRELKAIGYRYVTIDLDGYRTGSLNEALAPPDVSSDGD